MGAHKIFYLSFHPQFHMLPILDPSVDYMHSKITILEVKEDVFPGSAMKRLRYLVKINKYLTIENDASVK